MVQTITRDDRVERYRKLMAAKPKSAREVQNDGGTVETFLNAVHFARSEEGKERTKELHSQLTISLNKNS